MEDLGDPPGIWPPARVEFADFTIAMMKQRAEHDQNTWALYPEKVGDTWEAMFRVGNQGFYIGHGDARGSKALAEWWCERLAVALRHIGVSEKNRAEK